MLKHHFKRFSRHAQRAITLVEILAVVAIIGLIVGIAVPAVNSQIQKARGGTAKATISTIEQALETFNMDCGFYPQSPEPGLSALIQEPTVGRRCRGYNDKGYLKNGVIPEDPWGEQFMYTFPSQRPGADYDVYSSGPDGQVNTEDDIGNWPDQVDQDA